MNTADEQMETLADEQEPERFDYFDCDLEMGRITTVQARTKSNQPEKNVKFTLNGAIPARSPTTNEVHDVYISVELKGKKEIVEFVMTNLGIIEMGDKVHFELNQSLEMANLDKSAIESKKRSSNVISGFFE